MGHSHEEMKVFESFIDMLIDKFSKDPKCMFITTDLSVSTLKSYWSFLSRSDELDHLLRNNIFIDLYKLVK